MILITIYSISILLLLALLVVKYGNSRMGEWCTKPTLSLMFILVAFTQTTVWTEFHLFMVSGLVLCFAGDVCLIPDNKKMFMAGLISFLTGHLLYVAAFYQIASPNLFHGIAAGGILLVNAAVLTWLWRHIDGMRVPVLSYMIVISLMVLAAFTVASNEQLIPTGRLLLLGGAIGFFVSDIFVVREQFVTRSFINPLVGLPLYYGSQFALAISLGHLDG
jgi:uncharacterized membrane protein YhhN|tara:strand:- start:25263 stop:25919 length:657 start_codon:yes stop_codon:yes gene_type:complete